MSISRSRECIHSSCSGHSFVEPIKEPAQNVPGITRATQRASGFLPCLVARSRALCALKEPAQNGCGVKRAPQRNSEFLRCLGARIRRLCALKKSRRLSFSPVFESRWPRCGSLDGVYLCREPREAPAGALTADRLW